MSKKIHLGESLSVEEDDLRALLKDVGYALIPQSQIVTCYAEDQTGILDLPVTRGEQGIPDHIQRDLRLQIGYQATKIAVRFPLPEMAYEGAVFRGEMMVVLPDPEQ